MTAPSLTQKMATSSTPFDFSSVCLARYPGIWRVDQVGVKAPGSPTTTIFLPLQMFLMGTLSGGKPRSNVASNGSFSPTLMPPIAEKVAAHANARSNPIISRSPGRNLHFQLQNANKTYVDARRIKETYRVIANEP